MSLPNNNHTAPLLPRLNTAIDVILDPAPSRSADPSAPKIPPSSSVLSSPVWAAFCASQSRVLSFTGHKTPESPQHLFALIGAPCPSSTWMTPEDKLYLVFTTHDEARLALSVLDHHHLAVPALECDLEPFHLLRKFPLNEQQQEKNTANKPEQQRMAIDAHPHYAHQDQQQGGIDHLNAQLDALTLLHTEPHGVFEFPISSNPPNPKTMFRAGDWICGSRSCAAHNFGRNTTCRGCGSSRPGTAATALLPSPVPFPSTSTHLHISASSAATSSPVLYINSSSPPMTINIAAANNNTYPLSMSAVTVAKGIHNGNIPHHPHHRASMLPAQPSPRFANLHGGNNNHRSNTGRTSSLPSSYNAADPRSPTAIASARLFAAGAPKHATCASTSSSSSLPSSPMTYSDRLNAPGAMYPLLTPSGRAFAAGGRVQNVSRDPMMPCIMYWPENEPLPEPGQMRPASLTGIAQPPILNTGNRGPIEHQPGDWICQKCNYLNWRRRKVCQTCFPYAEGNGDSISAAVQAERIALLSSVLSDAEQRASPLAPAALRATSSSASAATAYSSSSSASSLPPSPTSSSSCSSGSGHHHSHHSQMVFIPQVLPGGVRARYEPSSPGAGLHPQLPHGPQSPYKPQQQQHNLVSRPPPQLQQINLQQQQQQQQRSGSSATPTTQAHRARVMLGPSSAPVHVHHTPASPLAYGTAIYETSSSPFSREEKWVSYAIAAEEEEGYVLDDHIASPCLPGFLQHLILPSSTTAVAPQGSPSWPSSDSDVADDNTSVSDSSSCASGPFSSSSSSRNYNNIWSLDGEETKMLHGSARLAWLGL